jgi:23S rRNA (cytosine1962-C5)-methyltransferase
VDQRENRLRVAEVARGAEVLDLYAGTGGFSLQALLHGAARCTAVESSARACASLRGNAALNGVADRVEVREEDARAALLALRDRRAHFGVVVADPPNFMPRRGGGEGAAWKGYRELNARALSRVAPDGFLATFSCSARVDTPTLLAIVREAARECRRQVSVLRELTAGPDHPVAVEAPEGRYLTGLLLRVRST